ncbi:tRNA lysidine(34) synthetase TilS [Brevundimonas sp.]|uniref:tRNA lysidine(34) synthetase TilS n=1 Tax=Brevundimonas sp. TaxID=1871086 RepID=UPI001DF15F36|nr:tRNA lysidine(34) synthetase TilS [Brevundimonas sp.]MBL0948717.1 tRNA lysidine(34) synthetase TilS [Brevundimonas sp.]
MRVKAALTARLVRDDPAPVAVAVSGGGDSVALLHLAHEWAAENGRSLAVLHVDHGLNPDSRLWHDRVRDMAGRLGAAFHSARWEGPYPATGLPAAARAARHARLADMARTVGARVILTGHTADDVAEGRWMQAEGSTLGTLRDWSPSPAWPEGRGLMLLRPLLGERRADLRHGLKAHGIDWIEDPANTDLRYGRSRARQAVVDGDDADIPRQDRPPRAAGIAADKWGVIRAPRNTDARALAFGLVVAGGGVRLPRGDRLVRLTERVAAGENFTAGLVGARLIAGAEGLTLVREAGDYRRRVEPVLHPAPGVEAVWDGRFAVTVDAPGWRVASLAGRAARLGREDRAIVAGLPAASRPGLPVLIRDGETGPVLAQSRARVEALAAGRLALSLGRVEHEADLKCRREWRTDGRAPIL